MSYVQVPVPEDRVEEIIHLVYGPSATPTTAAPTEPTIDAINVFADPVKLAKRCYEQTHDDGVQAKLLEFLATHPDERINYPDICSAIGIGRRSLPAALGALSRRVKHRYGNVWPFEFFRPEASTGWEWSLRMPADKAEVIREVGGL